MPELQIVQLVDKQQKPITPYTPAASVYYHYTEGGVEKWVNMETKIGAIDVDRIQNTQASILNEIEDKKEWAIDKIDSEGNSYRSDINAISGNVESIESKMFPLNVSTIVANNYSTMKTSYDYIVTEYDEPVVDANIQIRQKSNDNEWVTIYDGNIASQTLLGDTPFGKDTYNLICTKGGKMSQKTDISYLCLYGAYRDTITPDILKNASIISRKGTNDGSFTATVNTTSTNQYIWVATPDYLSITNITSGGFNVTMNNYIEITINGAVYKVYRSKNALQQATWHLIVS